MTYIRHPDAFDPTTYSAEHDRTHNAEPGDIIVTATSHPALFEVFETISADNGGGAGHTNYSVPNHLGERAQHAEDFLARMTKEERETVAQGEETEAEAIMTKYGDGGDVEDFLEAFFNDWEES